MVDFLWGVSHEDRFAFGASALPFLKKGILKKDARGRVIESPEEMFRRVARNMAEAERTYNHPTSIEELSESFFG